MKAAASSGAYPTWHHGSQRLTSGIDSVTAAYMASRSVCSSGRRRTTPSDTAVRMIRGSLTAKRGLLCALQSLVPKQQRVCCDRQGLAARNLSVQDMANRAASRSTSDTGLAERVDE